MPLLDVNAIDRLEDLDLSVDSDGVQAHRQMGLEVVESTTPSAFKTVVIAVMEYSQGKHYPRVILRRYRKMGGTWRLLPKQVKLHGDDVPRVAQAMLRLAAKLEALKEHEGYPWDFSDDSADSESSG